MDDLIRNWKQISADGYHGGVGYNVLTPDGKIHKNKKLYDVYFGKDDEVNVEPAKGVLYMSQKVDWGDWRDRKAKTKWTYTKPIKVAECQFEEYDKFRIANIRPHLEIGQFITLKGIRDTRSFRRIENIDKDSVFGPKYVLAKQPDKSYKLTLEYVSSQNGIDKITSILDPAALERGEYAYLKEFKF